MPHAYGFFGEVERLAWIRKKFILKVFGEFSGNCCEVSVDCVGLVLKASAMESACETCANKKSMKSRKSGKSGNQ